MSLILEESKENQTSSYDNENRSRDNPEKSLLESPPPKPKDYRWEPPEVTLFTPVPGYRMVRKEEYDLIMAQNQKVRQSENMPSSEPLY